MNIAINGFGRIGRAIFKIALDRKINVLAINDTHGPESAAYMLKFDSVYGKYNRKVEAGKDFIKVDGKRIRIVSERDPLKLPWKQLGIDVVVESTGALTNAKDAISHIKAGAKKVVITAPAKSPDVTIVPGVNDAWLKPSHKIISVGSCTTNCAATIAKVLMDTFGVKYAMLTTIHAYTNDQAIQDSAHHNIRRGRAGALNMVPTTTGAAETVIEVLPKLKGLMTGLSVRVPVACGSLTDLTVEVLKKATVRSVNATLKRAARTSMRGIIEYSEDELVSSDVINNPHSAVVDALSTQVDGNLVKVLAWYDNEYGYSQRVVDVLERLK
ncbi:MAG: type I glyceraldehyde-3-phosphate dehydrogenase [Nanoarchaeota archaeon]